MALRQREASLLRRKTVVRCASCGLKLEASAAWLARHRRGGARCLWGGGAARELASRARACRAGCDRSVSRRKMPRRRDGSLFWRAAVVRRDSCDLQLQASAACLAQHRRVGARCLWDGGAAFELASRARGAAIDVVGLYPIKGRCDSERLLFFGAKPWCDVPAAASNSKPAPRGSRGEGAAALAVSGEEAQHSSLLSRAPCRAGCGRSVPVERRCAGERPLSFGARPWCDVPAAASNSKPAPRVTQRRRVGARCLWEEAQHSSLLARAPCRAGCARLFLQRALRRREASLLRRAPWCDVPAAASNSKPAPRGSRGAGAAALAVSGEEAQHSSLLRARAVPRWLWSVSCSRKTLRRREALSFGARPWCDVPAAASNFKPARVCRGAGAPALAVSGRRRSTRACFARAPCRAGCGRLALAKGAAPARGLSPSARAVVRRASCGLQRQASAACRAAQRALRSLSLGRRRSTRACFARAPCRAGCGRLMSVEGAAPARGLSPSARARGATCQLRPPTPSQRRVARAAQARCARCLWGGGAALELALRARRAALVVIGSAHRKRHCTGERPLSSGARPWCDVPAAASNSKPAPRVRAAQARCARCLWGGGAALELASRARRAALVVVGLRLSEGTAPARGLSPSARARGATCQLQPPTPSQRRVSRAAQARCARCLWGGGAALELASRARRAALVVVGPMPRKDTAPARGLSPSARAVVRRASCGLQLQASAACLARALARCALCLWGGGAALELAARAPCRAGCSRLMLLKGHCAGERPLSFGARPWCDVPAAASNAKPAPRVSRGAGAPALAVSGEEAQHSSLLRARAVPRWLWSAYACKRTLRRREASLLRRAPVVRRASCGLQRQASAACLARRRRAALAVSGEEAQHSSLLRARAVPRWLWSVYALQRTLRRREASLLRRAPVVRRASCGLQRQASAACLARRRRAALAVSGEEAQHSSLLRARAVPRWLWSAHALEEALRRREASLLRRAPVVRRASCGLQRQASAACLAQRRRACARCLWEEAQHSSLLRARAVPRWLWSVYAIKGTAPARGLSPSARARGATCQLRPPTPSQRRVSRVAQARLRSLSLGRRRSTRACCARAPCRAGCGRSMPKRTLRRREASLLRRAPWCDVPAAASNAKPAPRVSRAQRALRSLSLGRRRSTRACSRARRAALVVVGYVLQRALRRREASLLRRAPWCDVPAAASNAKPAPRVSRGAARAALAVSGEEAQHSSLLRARAVPRWLWSALRLDKALRRREASLLRRAPVVRRASCGLQRQASAACLVRRRRACARCLWGGGAALELAARARRAALVVVGLRLQKALRRREASLLRRAPVVRRASCGLQRQASAACLARRSARCARCLWGGGAALELASRARRAALVVVGSCLERHCAGERPLSFGARPWCDVPAAASNSKPAPRVSRSAGALRSLSLGGGAALELASRARRAALVVVGSMLTKALRRREASLLRRARGATCQLRPPTPSQRRVSRAAQRALRSLSLGRRRSTRACFARAPCRAGCGRSMP